jgi:hypothetical protein
MLGWREGASAMNQPRMRPRFAVELDSDVEDVMVALRDRAEDNVQGVRVKCTRRHGVLDFPKKRRNFWSPQLALTVEEIVGNAGRTRVVGHFSPHPHIWQAFVFIYGTLFAAGFFSLMFGFAELAMGRTPWALLGPVIATALVAFVYGATFIGQGLGAEEMYRLRAYLDGCVEDARARYRARPTTAAESAQL